MKFASCFMSPSWVRIAYSIEFLLSIAAVFTLWSQVGGQAHLDLMSPWWKLGLGLTMAVAIMRATVSAVNHEHAWNRATILWLALIVLIAVAMAWVTYYYHVHEAPGEGEEDTAPATVSLLHL